MAENIFSNIATINWIAALILSIFSNASLIISKTEYKREGWRKYKRGYSIWEIKQVIEMTDNEKIKKKLKQKIVIRRISLFLFISTPILIVIGNL